MADPTLIQFPPGEPPKSNDEIAFSFLGEKLELIAAHIEDISTALYEAMERGEDNLEIHDLILGSEAMLSFDAQVLRGIAKRLNPEQEIGKGGEE